MTAKMGGIIFLLILFADSVFIPAKIVQDHQLLVAPVSMTNIETYLIVRVFLDIMITILNV